MRQRTRVYVAGPITKGDLQTNIDNGRAAGRRLLKAGYAPFVPHLSAFWASNSPEALPDGTTHEDWMGMDLPWVGSSDAVLRLPGDSDGADREVERANLLHIPVYYDIDELIGCLSPITEFE